MPALEGRGNSDYKAGLIYIVRYCLRVSRGRKAPRRSKAESRHIVTKSVFYITVALKTFKGGQES